MIRISSLTAWLAIVASVAAGADPGAIDFARDIQPIFSSHCYSCHGEEKQKSGLRLDRKEDAFKGGESGLVIIAHNVDASLLLKLVSGQDPDRRMPPQGDPLSEEQIAALRTWIAEGAVWPEDAHEVAKEDIAPAAPDHWAFQPIQRPAAPAVSNGEWVRNPIDAFVLARLEPQGFSPSPEADKETLIRRLHLDLTGLPPSPEELDTFLNDPSPYAYDSLVNRLLASRHFGERWARYWLDLARYADSDGYEKDLPRAYAYRYRDWVIDALNRDLPYDQFVIEQLAGDLLPNPTLDQLVATGFHRNTLTNREGGIDPEEDRTKQNVDRANTTASVFLGLTLGCAQCHSHKYDPLTQREYYKFYGFFNVTQEKDVPAATPGEELAYKEAKAAYDVKVAELQQKIDAYQPRLKEKLAEWEKTVELPKAGWEIVDPSSFASSGGSQFAELDDKSLLLSGPDAPTDTYTVIATTRETGIRGFRLQALTHESFKNGGPGRAHNGNFVLGELTIYAAPMDQPDNKQQVKLINPKADYSQPDLDIANAIDGNPDLGWAIYKSDGKYNENRVATFEAAEPVGFPDGTILTFVLEHRYGRQHNIGRFRLATATEPPDAVVFPDGLRDALVVSADQRTPEQQQLVLDYFATQDAELKALRAPLDALIAAKPEPPKTMAQAMAANPDPPKTYIHERGDFLTKGDEVQLGTPAALPALHARNDVPSRLDLARWIASPENPLTARVEANRIWQHLFGAGLVRTPEDFGTRGEAPSHPELLDWLATELVAQGWSTKAIIRMIVTSATYRQSSHDRADLLDVDPENRLLARQNRFHVEAEIVRDLNLAASGLLHASVGGPSIRPEQPKDIADLGYAGQVKWVASPAPEKYRRGLYIFFQRTVPYPMLSTFDCPDSNNAVARRARSNTPLQALTLLNDPVFFECAKALGARMVKEGPADERERIRYAFRLCMGREPLDQELDRLQGFVVEQRAAFAADQEGAVRFASEGEPASDEAVETATYAALARVIMNLDEFVTRE